MSLITTKTVKTPYAKIVSDFYDKNSDLYPTINVQFKDFDEVEIELFDEFDVQEQIDERMDEIENGFINIVGRGEA